MIGDSDQVVEEIRVAVVTKPKSPPDQVEDLLRQLLAGVTPPVPVPSLVPEVPMMEKLLQHLVAETQIRQPGQSASVQQPRHGSFRRDWNAIVCFSCGKAGHSANRCPVLDESFPFMLLGWRAEKTPGGYMMISPRVAADSSTDSHSPGCGGYRSYEFIRVVRCGASVGAHTDFGGVGRGGQG